MTMTKTIEIKATEMIQHHLNRDPRVLSYRESPRWGDEIFEVEYDPQVACSQMIRAEARLLGIEL